VPTIDLDHEALSGRRQIGGVAPSSGTST
jgi:hypothetical protein